jgi:hypothetical protein
MKEKVSAQLRTATVFRARRCFLVWILAICSVVTLPLQIFAATIQLPQTGQTTCSDSSGNTISCVGTGQDGDLKMGVAWPSPRFVDNTNGTVSDKLTGLVWLKNANCFGAQIWVSSLSSANSLASGQCGLTDNSTAGQWRLPNVIEMFSLVNESLPNNATWLNSQGFSGVQSAYSMYWSSNTFAHNTDNAVPVNIDYGFVNEALGSNKNTNNFYSWPVRTEGSYAVQLPATGQTISYAPNDDGSLKKGVAWPNPRFLDNGDQSVTDSLTNLVWPKDANTPGPTACGSPTTKNWQGSLDYVKCLNTNKYLGKSDWRVPNRLELISLINWGQANPATWLISQGFSGVHSNIYWSSMSAAYGATNGLYVELGMIYGWIGDGYKSVSNYVWPVRGGQTSVTTANGTCGAASGSTVSTAPTTNFCATGTASTIIGTGPWYWTCDGTNGGTSSMCTAYLSVVVDPTITKTKYYMGSGNDILTVSNSGATVYGNSGYDTVTIADGISGITLDQNVERINFSGTASSYAFKQTGNKINIYSA